MTCHFFRHHPGPECIPLLTCHLHQGLITQGEHLTHRCSGWSEDLHRQRGWAPDAISVADRICQRRHQEWIEAFLVSHS